MLRVFEAVLRLKVMRYVSCANNVQQGGHFILETFFNIPVTPFSVFPAEVLQVGIPTYCIVCHLWGENVGRVDFQFITPLDGNMTALVINGTQVEGGGGYFLGKCNTGCYQISRGTE